MKYLTFLLLAVILLSPSLLPAQLDDDNRGRDGIEGEMAPPLGVSDWIQLPEGKERLGIPDFRDKVLVMLMFQSTCTACEFREFPVLKQLVEEFEGDDGVAFLAIQTTFENFSDNSELALQPTADKHDLQIPFGHLAKTPDNYSINIAYDTPGTPWWVVVDREGKVVFNDKTMHPDVATDNIRKLIAGESPISVE
ncbi:MAG: TlpA disulfide reductase family protein [Verrucomicrobiota bacterium]